VAARTRRWQVYMPPWRHAKAACTRVACGYVPSPVGCLSWQKNSQGSFLAIHWYRWSYMLKICNIAAVFILMWFHTVPKWDNVFFSNSTFSRAYHDDTILIIVLKNWTKDKHLMRFWSIDVFRGTSAYVFTTSGLYYPLQTLHQKYNAHSLTRVQNNVKL
jgi:hypothetical protein